MKLETAQRLNWPWVTEKAFCLNDTGEYEVVSSQDCKHAFYRDPSVEEMLERMPQRVRLNILTIRKLPGNGYEACYEYGREQLTGKYNDNLSESIALLCIWLRDNKLIEWIYKEEEK